MARQRHCVVVTAVYDDDDVKWIYLSHTWLKVKNKQTGKNARMIFYLMTTLLNGPAQITAGHWQVSKKKDEFYLNFKMTVHLGIKIYMFIKNKINF